MHVHTACTLARAAQASGVSCPTLDSLARLGADGKYPANEHRDFRKLMQRQKGLEQLEPQQILLTLLSEEGEGQIDVMTDVLAPYEVLHFLHKSKVFARSMLSDDLSLSDYWRTMFSRSIPGSTDEHPLKGDAAKWSSAIPLVFLLMGQNLVKAAQLKVSNERLTMHNVGKWIPRDAPRVPCQEM